MLRLLSLLSAAAGTLVCVTAFAQSVAYPARPVRIVVPGAAGSSQEVVSRVVGNKLTQQMGQS